MHELGAHLQHDPSASFAPRELNHIILMVYNFLTAAVRERCDTVRFTPFDVTWIREDCPAGQFSSFAKHTISFREAMEHILERDEIVRRHVRLVSETPDEAIYRITDGSVAAPTLAGAASGAPTDD